MKEDWTQHFRKTMLDIRLRVEAALAQEDRAAGLSALVRQLFAEGATQQQLYDVFLNEHLRLRMENREVEEELIADVVLDGLSGWCSSSSRFFPDEPDAK